MKWGWVMKAWNIVKTHKKKVGAVVAAAIAAAEYLGYTGLASTLGKALGYLAGIGG